MSEKLPESKRRGLRFEGMLAKIIPGLRRERRASRDESIEDPEAAYNARRRERMDRTPAGPGLKGYDLELNLFQYSTDMSELESVAPPFHDTFRRILAEYRASHPEDQPKELGDDNENPFVSLMYSSDLLSRPTQELSAWLYENTPQNGYFTPEMIEEAVVDDPEIQVTKHSEDGLDIWRFSDTGENSFTLSRPSDGKRPVVQTRPYLGVHYWTEYDPTTEELVSSPRLSTNSMPDGEYGMFKRSDFAAKLARHLNLEPIRLAQKIDFQIVGAKPAPYFSGPERESFESVIAQTHVEADFPKAA